MSLSPVGATSASMVNAASGAEKSQRKSSLNQEDFLSLFLVQMQYQDPLNPMDNAQMSTQMAQLSTVEGINKMTQSIDQMGTYQASIAHLQTAGLVGKKVEVLGNQCSIDQGKVSEGSYALSKPGRVTIEIRDEKGTVVKTIEQGYKGTSKQGIVWDGRNQQGASLPDGKYTFTVKAVDEKGQMIHANTSIIGIVNRLSFENGVPYLNVGSTRVTLADIIAVLA